MNNYKKKYWALKKNVSLANLRPRKQYNVPTRSREVPDIFVPF